MTLGLQRCSSTGWRQCDGIAVTGCVICGSALCEPCRKRHAVTITLYKADERSMLNQRSVPCCSKPSCKRLLAIREHYGELVEEGRL